jgi:hypothetical protein
MTMSVRKAKRRIVAMMASTVRITLRWLAPDAESARLMRQLLRDSGRVKSAMRAALKEPAPRHAILIGHDVKSCNLMTWARWMEAQRQMPGLRGGTGLHVADEWAGNARVSTVFLGINHAWGNGPPLWFETMVFIAGDADADMERYSTWAEAEAGHAAMMQRHRSPDPTGNLLDHMLRQGEGE